jgi:hypothetical protein
MVKSLVVVAFVLEKAQEPPTPEKVRFLKSEFVCTVLPAAVDVSVTVPLLLTNVPVEFVNEPPTVSVPEGRVTAPAEIVKSFVVVAFAPVNDHAPPEPENVAL